MKYTFLLLIFLLCCCSNSLAGDLPPFAVARQPIPVFNSAEAALPGAVQKRDRCGQIRELELIALPGTVFRIVATVPETAEILQVTTDDYQAPAGTNLYVATALLALQHEKPEARKQQLPQRDLLFQKLRSAIGLPYVWGGNLRAGIHTGGKLQFAGLDCSGLLYEATNGSTPRNTEQLVQFGTAVTIEGLGLEKLVQQLRPLDLIVWKGHVIIVLDQKTAVESILNCSGARDGVVTTPLDKRLKQLLKQRKAVNSWPSGAGKSAHFVVRRWI